MKRIRLGVIGAGMAWERLHYPALQELHDRYEVVAVCDITREKSLEWVGRLGLGEGDAYGDYRQLLQRNDVDAVDILVPIDLNFIVAEAAAKAGKAVILEKPLAPTLEQARECLELPKKYHVPILVAENFRYSEEYNLLRDLVREKRVGDTVYFIAHNASCFPCVMTQNTFAATEWRQHPDYPGGDFLDAAIHDLAGLRHVFGGVRRVHALGSPTEADYSPYKSYHVNMHFHDGVIGQYTFSTFSKELQYPLIGLRIIGTQGQIYMEEKTCGVINIFTPGGHQMIHFRPGRGYYNELLNFSNAFLGREPIAVTPEMEFGDARMVFQILESLKQGTVMEVDPVGVYEPAY